MVPRLPPAHTFHSAIPSSPETPWQVLVWTLTGIGSYLAVLHWAAFTTSLDPISPRFVLPVLPIAVMSTTMSSRPEQVCRVTRSASTGLPGGCSWPCRCAVSYGRLARISCPRPNQGCASEPVGDPNGYFRRWKMPWLPRDPYRTSPARAHPCARASGTIGQCSLSCPRTHKEDRRPAVVHRRQKAPEPTLKAEALLVIRRISP